MRTILTALLLSFAVFAHAANPPRWTEVRTPHFVVLTDSDERQARRIGGQFERMRSLFEVALPHAGGDASLPITVLALKDRKGFQALEPAAYLAKGQIQLAGYFLNTTDRNYILLRLDAEGEHPFSVVYHEYTHFILRKVELLPLWLNEGLAEFYQNTDIEEKSVRLGQPSVDNILYLRQNTLLPLATLFAVDHKSPYYHDEQKGSVFYAESWALTHLIEVNDFQNKTHRLQDYVHLINLHNDPVEAGRKVFGDLVQFQKTLQNYVDQRSYQLFTMNTTFTANEASFTARTVSLAEADAVRANVLANDDRRAEAQILLDAVLRDDPKNALAHETLGNLAFRDGNIADAKKWYGEAVQLDSQSYVAHFNYAVYSMLDSGADKDASIEASLRQVIKLEPTFAPAYDALARFYGMRHNHLDEARMLSRQAVQLDPANVRFRLNDAQIALEQENADDALAILRATLDLASDDGEGVMILQRIQQIKELQDHQQEASARTADQAQRNLQQSVESTVAGDDATSLEPEPNPYPTGPPTGPRHTASGTLRAVHCFYPTVLTLDLAQPGKPLSLYTPNYFKIPFTTLGFTQTSDLDPCKAIEGMKARITYTTVTTDKRVSGQIVSIQLMK